MVRRSAFVLGAAAVLALTGSSGVSSAVRVGKPSAEAFAIQVSVPGEAGAMAGAVSGPPDAVGVGGSFLYPADGSVVQASSVLSSVSGTASAVSSAVASVSVSGLSLFGGEITVASVSAKATSRASGRAASGNTSGSAVSGMTVLGQSVATAPGTTVPLGDWGTASIVQQSASPYAVGRVRAYRAQATGLAVRLNAAHAGLPAGTDIVVGFTDVAVEGPPPPPPPPPPVATLEEKPKPTRPDRKKQAARPTIPLVRNVPFDVIPRLTASGYVFPIYGQASFTNTFAGPRGANVGGWHHGEDIFAPLGAPVLAVANGIVYSVGWNKVGGLRFWLQDLAGNEFYYAHLSAFSPLAVNGTQVRAGDVIGFVGNTGDAQGTPYHVHFEVHPVSLLYRGYDGGAVAPYPYLMAWKRLTDLPFSTVAGWAPPLANSSRVPKPGAILLQSRDISNANGLDPGSLRRALRASDPSAADGSIAEIGDGSARTRRPTRPRALSGPGP